MIGIASDHRGYDLKQEIINRKNYKDYGTDGNTSVDYPLYANKITKAVINKEIDLGILICGTGIGMSIAANRIKGIRCAKVDNLEDAKYAKLHNNANVLAFSSSKSIDFILECIDTFLANEAIQEEKYTRRNEMLDNLD